MEWRSRDRGVAQTAETAEKTLWHPGYWESVYIYIFYTKKLLLNSKWKVTKLVYKKMTINLANA